MAQRNDRKERWERDVENALARSPERRDRFATSSGIEVRRLYGPDDPGDGIGYPGQAPFTRGVQPTMYRGRLWTMRQFAGFGTPADTNRRFKYLISHGVTGLSTLALGSILAWLGLVLGAWRGLRYLESGKLVSLFRHG